MDSTQSNRTLTKKVVDCWASQQPLYHISYMLSVYYMSGTVLSIEYIAMNKANTYPCSHETYALVSCIFVSHSHKSDRAVKSF